MIDESAFRTLDQIAAKLFAAKVFPRTVETADMAFAILLAGHELGFGPMASARGITLVSGKVSLGADATVAACARHRDVCVYFSCSESTDDRATYVTQRAGAPAPVTLSYTIAQARRAGLTGSGTWRAHPEAMLRARCAAALARSVYPDLVAGVYDPDEAEEIRREDAQRIVTALPARPEHSQPPRPALAPPAAVEEDPERGAIEAESDAPAYTDAVDAIELPGEAVAVWLAHREAIAALSADDQKSAWAYLTARVAHVGKMTAKGAATWIKKAVADETARRAEVSA
jgi:hypothetical protein